MSGELDNPRAASNTSTHCSAFAASVAERLGIPLLRPPAHSQTFLASDQKRFIDVFGADVGWRKTSSLIELQAAANRGMFAVIARESLDPSVSGHIAVVRPNSCSNVAILNTTGPQMTQAGTNNYNNVTAKSVFPLTNSTVMFAIFDRRTAVSPLAYNYWTTSVATKQSYLFDLGPGGRIDIFKLLFTPTGLPTWWVGVGNLGISNATAWAMYYEYKLSNTTTLEPYTVSNKSVVGGTVSVGVGVGGTSLSLVDTATPITPTPDPSSSYVTGVTGLWYATVDNTTFGIFITRSTATNVGGMALQWAASGTAEYHTLDMTYSTNTPTSKIASGPSKYCYFNSTCIVSSPSVTVSLSGVGGSVTGLPRVSGVVSLMKASQYTPFLGPVV